MAPLGVLLWHNGLGSGIVSSVAWVVAVVQVRFLALELPHAVSTATKKKKKKNWHHCKNAKI